MGYIFWSLAIGFAYFFSLLWHFNYEVYGEPFYSIMAGSALLTSLALLYYYASLNIVWPWVIINSQSIILKLYRFLVAPYMALLWVVKYDYSIILKSPISVVLSLLLFITISLQNKKHIEMCENSEKFKADVVKWMGPPAWSLVDLIPAFIMYGFLCLMPLIFPSTFLRYN